jgi:type I restriction enzyme, S subunit
MKYINFGEIADFKNGLNFENTKRNGILKIVGVADFKNFSTISTNNLETIQMPDKLSKEYLLLDGDLLFVRSNGNKELIGRCLYLENIKEPVSHSGFTIRARLKNKTFSYKLIAAYFACGLAAKHFNKHGSGTNISNLNQSILSTIPIPIFSIAEQKKIEEILETCDRQIELTEKLITAKRQLKRGLM